MAGEAMRVVGRTASGTEAGKPWIPAPPMEWIGGGRGRERDKHETSDDAAAPLCPSVHGTHMSVSVGVEEDLKREGV